VPLIRQLVLERQLLSRIAVIDQFPVHLFHMREQRIRHLCRAAVVPAGLPQPVLFELGATRLGEETLPLDPGIGVGRGRGPEVAAVVVGCSRRGGG
jgi:hypothetical protein